MLATLLALAGAAVALFSLWQLRRWLAEGEAATAAMPRRLEALVDELLVTAETTSTVVQEKAEALAEAIAEADRRLADLRAAARVEPEARVTAVAAEAPPVSQAVEAVAEEPVVPTITLPLPEPAPEPVAAVQAQTVPDLHRQVYALADAGQDVTTVARKLGLTKGEVQLILGLRQNGQGGATC